MVSLSPSSIGHRSDREPRIEASAGDRKDDGAPADASKTPLASTRVAERDEIDEHVQRLRGETLTALLIALGVLMWLVIVSYLLHPDDFLPGWGSALLVLAAIVGSYALKDQRYHLASGLLIVGLAGAVTAQFLAGGDPGPAAPFLYLPVVLIAGTLQGTPTTLGVAAVASATLVMRGLIGPSGARLSVELQALAVIWLTVLIAWLTTRNLSTTLLWYWHTQMAAARSLEEVRRQRGDLAGALKQLADATYRLERMNYALNWARLDAEQARRAKAQFAAHVSHELRTPINLIVGFSDMMLNVPQAYPGVRLPLAYLTDLQTLHRNARHLQAMIDDILDLSQLDAQAMPLLRETIPVATVIEEAVATVRQLFERKSLAIQAEIRPNVTTAYLDPLRIRQVLLNLLSNAARHTARGGVTVRAWREGDNVVIAVADTGEGINPRDIPHLFEPFQRFAASSAVHEGWGLGLAICKQFIELHGGSIVAASEGAPGGGATFTIALPVHPTATDSHADLGPVEHHSGWITSRLRALPPPVSVVVVDADPHVVSLYRRYLSGYQVHGAVSEADALEHARSTGAQALLVNLPTGGRPSDWLQRWTSFAEEHGVRVIGCSLPSSQQLSDAVGLVDFLVKPVAREALLASVDRANPRARTIAVIDDDVHMVRLLDRMLRSAGQPWRVVRAYDGEEGLRLIREVRPDVVLLDLLLPRVEGISVVDAVRSDPGLAGVALIAVTAQDVGEVLALPTGRVLALVTDQGFPIAQTLQGVRALLDLLPPSDAATPGSSPVPGAAPVGSGASE
jgi:signal transduction histidine kinase/DNA-binding response OmpR family regulator